MNDFTLNGAEINGGPQVWLDDCFATFNFAGNGSSLFATPLGGLSTIDSSAALPLQIRKVVAGDAASSFTGNGSALFFASITGDSTIVLSATLQPQIRKLFSGDAAVSLSGNGSSLFATPLGGESTIDFSLALPPQIRKFFMGDAAVSASVGLPPQIRKMFAGDASVVFAGGLPLSIGYSLIGNGQSTLSASGELLRKAMVNGNTAAVVTQSNFSAVVFRSVKSDLFIQMQGSAEFVIAKSVFGEHLEALVILDTNSRYQPNFSTHHGDGSLQLRLNANAKLNVWMYSPSADGFIRTDISGDTSIGKKINIESDTLDDGIFVKGNISSFRYINLDGEAKITIRKQIDSFMRVQLMPKSPDSRTLFVSKQDRTLIITG